MDTPVVRESVRGDHAAIESIYPAAFPDEDLVPLVRDLLRAPEVAMSLVATLGSAVAGHVVFTRCGIEGGDIRAALLGPLAVAPMWQRRGIGSALVRNGLGRLRDEDVHLVCVLGDPGYYSRFGFVPDTLIAPPYPLPAEWSDAWQSLYLGDPAAPCAGRLSVPEQWLQPGLWQP